MLFASTALAQEIERAERDLIMDGVDAARSIRDLPGSFATDIGGGVAAFVETGSPFNKVAGLGFGGRPSDAEFDAMEHAYRERGAPVQVELATLADPEVGSVLTRRGYVLRGYENALGRSTSLVARRDVSADIEIEEIGADGIDEWLDVVVDGFAAPDDQGVPPHESFPREALRRVIGDMVAAPGIVRFLARRHGEPAGGASMRVDGEIAQCCGAATVPAHRRNGVQTALLHRRLRFAEDAGCVLVVVTTVPGTKSQENAQRGGFELLYARAVLSLEVESG